LVDKKLSKQQQQCVITIFYNFHKEEEDKSPDDCLLNSNTIYLYVEKLPKYRGESACFKLSSESGKQLIPTKTQKETNLRQRCKTLASVKALDILYENIIYTNN
jgi:hypothetical protein